MSKAALLLVGALAAATGPVRAQQHAGHDATSPYADLQSREIKALSAEEVAGLEAGDGLGFALPAELNGVPGPKHVLELADSLALTAEQRASIERIEGEMRASAKALGARLLEAERALDALFAGGGATAGSVEAAAATAGSLRAELRAAHLVAHLATVEVLTPEQVRAYRHLRGYHADG